MNHEQDFVARYLDDSRAETAPPEPAAAQDGQPNGTGVQWQDGHLSGTHAQDAPEAGAASQDGQPGESAAQRWRPQDSATDPRLRVPTAGELAETGAAVGSAGTDPDSPAPAAGVDAPGSHTATGDPLQRPATDADVAGYRTPVEAPGQHGDAALSLPPWERPTLQPSQSTLRHTGPGAPAAHYGLAAAPPQQTGRHREPLHGSESVGPMRAEVRQANLVRPHKPIPETGWRKRVYRVSKVNLGLSPAEREWNDLKRRLSVNLRGTYLIAMMQQKGGVSKTTATVGVGAALARYRDDKVVAIDANAASGNLAQRVDEPSTGTWRSLIADQNLLSYSDFRHYLGKDSSSGLEVLAGDPGDDVLSGRQLIDAWRRLSRQYPIGLVDCGNQMRDDITAAVLSAADAVMVVSTTRYDGALGAQETLNWLITHGYPHLVRSAVMVISNVNKVKATKAVRNLHEDFERVVRAVHDIPYDPHLSDASAIDFDRLAPATRRAFIEAAAAIVDGFPGAADKDPGYRFGWSTDHTQRPLS